VRVLSPAWQGTAQVLYYIMLCTFSFKYLRADYAHCTPSTSTLHVAGTCISSIKLIWGSEIGLILLIVSNSIVRDFDATYSDGNVSLPCMFMCVSYHSIASEAL